MTDLTRRALVAAAATVAVALPAGKPRAEGGQDSLHPIPEAVSVADLKFASADGTARTVGDYAGQGVVLNLWATWCIPCIREMPALDDLAGLLKEAGIAVLPLSSDRGGAAAVQGFYAARGIRNLPVLLDPGSAAAHALSVRGIPTTLLVDRRSRAVAMLEGGAGWAAPAMVEQVRRLIG